MGFIVLKLRDNEKGEGWLPHLDFQIATISQFDSMEDAAKSNVGNHPDAAQRRKPYKVVVIPEEHFNVFDVFSESHKGVSEFVAYPTDDKIIG